MSNYFVDIAVDEEKTFTAKSNNKSIFIKPFGETLLITEEVIKNHHLVVDFAFTWSSFARHSEKPITYHDKTRKGNPSEK